MSRPDAARKLLALGALNYAEFLEITGWAKEAVAVVLSELIACGDIARRQVGRGIVYALTEEV